MMLGTEVDAAADPARSSWLLGEIGPGSTVGVGSLPHRCADDAARFSLSVFDVATLPSLPRRSPAEAPVAQALVGVAGVALGQYGALAIDTARLDPEAPVATGAWQDSFTGFHATLAAAAQAGHEGPVKWQFVGPVTVGMALIRAGAEPQIAFRIAERVVRSHLDALGQIVSESLPNSAQVIVLDEPTLTDVMAPEFPIPPDAAIDAISSAMAAIEKVGVTGVHCCGSADLGGVIATGSRTLWISPEPSLVSHAGYLQRFLREGGWVVWGAVPTDGPIGAQPGRSVAKLELLWRRLAERGCDPALIRERALISPQCGLGGLNQATAAQVCESMRAVAEAVRPARP